MGEMAIPKLNFFQQPIQRIGAVGAGSTQGAGKAGSAFGNNQTPFQNDMNDFRASIAGWKGHPNLNLPGDPKLDFNA